VSKNFPFAIRKMGWKGSYGRFSGGWRENDKGGGSWVMLPGEGFLKDDAKFIPKGGEWEEEDSGGNP